MPCVAEKWWGEHRDRGPVVKATPDVNINTHQLACAAKRGFGLLENPPKITYISQPFTEFQKYKRFNDGACDPK